ncbi:MAG: SurA N-terminal domain-containing protein, partial [Bauldia litoralis]
MILIPPFAVVGVDYIFQGGLTRSAAVVTVGDLEIAGTQFERDYRNRINAVQRQFKTPLDYKTAKQLGLVERITAG